MPTMKPVPNSHEITLFSDGFDPLGIGVAANNFLSGRLLADGVKADLPAQYDDEDGRGGPPVDALTIYVDLPFGTWEEDHILYQIDLRELVEDALGWKGPNGGPAKKMAAELRKLADWIDAQGMETEGEDPLGASCEA